MLVLVGLYYHYALPELHPSSNPDYAEAANWYEKAAAAGNAPAAYNLGLLYEDGFGVQKDLARAVTYFQKAADTGHAGAMKALGELYVHMKQWKTAFTWTRKAAELGHPGDRKLCPFHGMAW